MRNIKHITELLFRAVALLFSAVLLILSLLHNISLAASSDSAAGLMAEKRRLEEENEYLRAEISMSLSLEEIERYAREELCMVYRSPENLIYMGD